MCHVCTFLTLFMFSLSKYLLYVIFFSYQLLSFLMLRCNWKEENCVKQNFFKNNLQRHFDIKMEDTEGKFVVILMARICCDPCSIFIFWYLLQKSSSIPPHFTCLFFFFHLFPKSSKLICFMLSESLFWLLKTLS